MGFLNHSTNNIIIDAVLTERGRELLSRNDGTFKITQFSFGDDEVDYTNITKYGKIIGKEKIEKNTPIFEASTNENIALKNKLINLGSANVRILYLPILESYSDANAATSLEKITLIYGSASTSAVNKEKVVFMRTNITAETTNTSLDSSIIDTNFIVKLNSDLLDLKRDQTSAVLTPLDIDQNKIATYRISLNGTSHPDATKQSQGLRQTSFYAVLKSTLTSDAFSKFGRSGDATKIDTTIQIIGDQSNATKVLPVQINLGDS